MFEPQKYLTKLKKKTRDGRIIEADYLEVKWRIAWFRAANPDWTLASEIVELNDQKAVFMASVYDPSGRIIATGHGSETPGDFSDYIEKAETKAWGRALGNLGFGTQFAPELDEEDRIVDSPVEPKNEAPAEQSKGVEVPSAYRCINPKCNKFVTKKQADDTNSKHGKIMCQNCEKLFLVKKNQGGKGELH